MPTRTRPPHPEYLKFLQVYDREIVDLTLAVREAVLREAWRSEEILYDAYNAVAAGYTFTGRTLDACIHIATYVKWVNLGFNYGATLPDPDGLLKGTGNRIRHVRITGRDQLKMPAVRRLIRAAVENAIYPANGVLPRPITSVRAIYARKRRPGTRQA